MWRDDERWAGVVRLFARSITVVLRTW